MRVTTFLIDKAFHFIIRDWKQRWGVQVNFLLPVFTYILTTDRETYQVLVILSAT